MSAHNDYAAFIREELAVKYNITLDQLRNPPSHMTCSPDKLIYDAASRLVDVDEAKRELISSTVTLIAILLGGKRKA